MTEHAPQHENESTVYGSSLNMGEVAVQAASSGLNMGEVSTGAAETETKPISLNTELLSDPLWSEIDTIERSMESRVRTMIAHASELEKVISRVRYDSSEAMDDHQEIMRHLNDIETVLLKGFPEKTLLDTVTSLYNKAIAMRDAAVASEETSEEERAALRRSEDSVAQIHGAARIIFDEFKEVRKSLSFSSNLRKITGELIDESFGVEHSLSILAQSADELANILEDIQGKLSQIEIEIDSVQSR